MSTGQMIYRRSFSSSEKDCKLTDVTDNCEYTWLYSMGQCSAGIIKCLVDQWRFLWLHDWKHVHRPESFTLRLLVFYQIQFKYLNYCSKMTLTFFFLYWMTHALLCYLLLSFVMVVSGLLCRAGRPTGVLWPCGATRWQQYDMVSEVGFKPTPPFGDQNAHSLFPNYGVSKWFPVFQQIMNELTTIYCPYCSN